MISSERPGGTPATAAAASPAGVDALLHRFLAAPDGEPSEALLGELLSLLHPYILRVARARLSFRPADLASVEDICGQVTLEVLARLRRLKESNGIPPVDDLRAYAAAAAANACSELIRRRYPRRTALKKSLRHHLRTNPAFALWKHAGSGLLCGLAKWRSSPLPPARLDEAAQWRDSLANLAAASAGSDPAATLDSVFRAAGAPLKFDQAVDAVAELWGVRDQTVSIDEHGEDLLPASSGRPEDRMERQRWMRRLWEEVRELPVAQRTALLLNLRSEGEHAAVALFPLTGTATIRQIAETLEIPAPEFAALWNTLPLDDLAIALRLGLTRQQVINLRKSARARLARRLGPEISSAGSGNKTKG